MKNRIIILDAAVIVAAGVIAAIIIAGHYRTSGLNPANPPNDTDTAISERGTLTVSSVTGSAGEDVEVIVTIKDNPGIFGMTLSANYVTGVVTLTDAKSGEALNEVLTFTKPGSNQNNSRFLWDGMELSEDQIKDGDVLILTFHNNVDAELGEYHIL